VPLFNTQVYWIGRFNPNRINKSNENGPAVAGHGQSGADGKFTLAIREPVCACYHRFVFSN
jgi:hypothetical protein